MTVEWSKRRSLLALTFIAKSTSKNLLIRIQSVFVLLLCDSLRRGKPKISVETKSWISLALKSLFFYEILQKASLNTKPSKPYAKSEV